CVFKLGKNLKNDDHSQKMFIVTGILSMKNCSITAKGKTAVCVSHSLGTASFTMKDTRITGSHAYLNNFFNEKEQLPLIDIASGRANLISGTITCTDPERTVIDVGQRSVCTQGKNLIIR
ncbi:MAG: hypothetical protein Q4B75_10885, partial [Eubacteriales bacterium]|nr:hypothetical protein [Eubacteriales bacterium]